MTDPHGLLAEYRRVRDRTERLCSPLAIEDYVVQTMPDVSPTKWHLAHTSWFFETFVLEGGLPGYRPFHDQYRYVFNSYYYSVGPMHYRPHRGFLSRPTVKEIYAYREHVDRHMEDFLVSGDADRRAAAEPVVTLGLHHEQQHQELIATDVKHVLAQNPLHPVYRELDPGKAREIPELGWIEHGEGLREIGHGGPGFAFDNETPRHRQFVPGFRLADRLVTNREYLEFMKDGGYETPTLWLSDGWYAVEKHGWRTPMYWMGEDDDRRVFTLGGLREVRPAEPVCHLSHYEADAFARWAGARLPTEAEWEVAAREAEVPLAGNLQDADHLHPVPLTEPTGGTPRQMIGDVWEWTQSAYQSYPGFKPAEGALGEYNGKFMSGQIVLRGGSCATPRSHIRTSYRNFWPPHTRWQFTGIRLAQDS